LWLSSKMRSKSSSPISAASFDIVIENWDRSPDWSRSNSTEPSLSQRDT
jgi:hypothetical protein